MAEEKNEEKVRCPSCGKEIKRQDVDRHKMEHQSGR